MLEFARPSLLVAGALAALVPLVLHLIARRPPERVPLPTARFLTPDARTAVRIRRRPADLLLLALRMLFLLLLGAAAAGPAWLPRQEGTAELVLLERGAGMEGAAWRAAVDAARRTLLGPEGEARGALVLFDTAATTVPPHRVTLALFDSLAGVGPGSASPDYAAALRAVPRAARELRGADSARATLLSALRWEGWRPGLERTRRAAWPGMLRLADLPLPDRSTAADALPSGRARSAAVVLAPPGEGRYAAAALGATGWEVRAMRDDPADVHLLLGPVDAGTAARLLGRVRAGATLVVAGADASEGLGDILPWAPSAEGRDSTRGGVLVFEDGMRLAGAESRASGAPRPGARLLAAWEDGRPAAAAARVGWGCVVHLATELEGGTLPLSASFPRAVDRLARGCGEPDPAGGEVPLDAGALSVLRGDTLPGAVALASLGGSGGGLPLGRWVLGAALLLALLETVAAYGRRRA